MKRAIGLGGLFIKSKNPKELQDWYRTHLGIDLAGWGGTAFPWKAQAEAQPEGATVWSIFDADNDYFAPSDQLYMMNFLVDDLDALLDALRSEGVALAGEPKNEDYGKFAWIMDPEGRKVELWEPLKTAE